MQQEGAKARRFEDGSSEVIAACIEVHRHLGPGLLESTYEHCVCKELDLRGIPYERQRPVPVLYKGEELECGYRLDVVIKNQLVLELKSVERLTDIHHAQLITYLRLSSLQIGLLINFNVSVLRHGLRRVVNRR